MTKNSVKRMPGARADRKLSAKHRLKKVSWSLFRFVLLFALGYVVLFPILFMLSNALRSGSDAVDPTIIWIPKHFTLQNFKSVFTLLNYPEALKNTVIISVVSAVLQVFVSAMSGYAFAKYKFPLKRLLFVLVLLTTVIPQQMMVMSLYLKYRFLDIAGIGYLISLFTGKLPNILDSYLVFFLPSALGVGIKGGLFIYIFRQFFRGTPDELLNAAKIDGCGHFGMFARVALPNAKPAIVSVFLFSLVWHWSEIYYSSMFLTSKQMLSPKLESLRTEVFRAMTSNNPSILQLFNAESGSIESVIQSGAFLVVLPVLILYMFVQKLFVQSVERTGLVE